jgi:hypothetical protein
MRGMIQNKEEMNKKKARQSKCNMENKYRGTRFASWGKTEIARTAKESHTATTDEIIW